MKIARTKSGVYLQREPGDPKLYKESTVTFHLRNLLRELDGSGDWRRFYPNRCGLTDCRQGVCNSRTGEAYWHALYVVELAHEAYNAGEVFYARADSGA